MAPSSYREVMTRPLGETPFQPPLVTDRLLLRPFTLTDVEGLVRIGEGGFIADTTITVPASAVHGSARHWLIDDPDPLLTRAKRYMQSKIELAPRWSAALAFGILMRPIVKAS